MGDRFVVGFRGTQESPTVWLYSHWGGSDRVELIADAIEKARPRWTDPGYATRIAISRIVGDAWNEELGFAIMAGDRDFYHPDYDDVHVVTWLDRTVVVQTLDGERDLANFGFEVFLSIVPTLR